MEKKPKNEELNFIYLDEKYIKKEEKQKALKNKKQKNHKKVKQKTGKKVSNKKETFNFEEEMVIGMTKTPTKSKKKVYENTQKGAKLKKAPVKNKKDRQAKKKKEKKVNPMVASIIKWIILLTALVASFIFFMMSPLFNITQVTVSNNQKVSSEMIISLSGIQIGENIYKTSSNRIQKRIKENAYIESVTVARKLPNQIELIVKERKPTYMLEYASSYAYINNQGYILEIAEQKLELPIISGYVTPQEEIEVGKRLQEEDLERLSAVLKIIESANGNGLGEFITRITISNKQNYVLHLESKQKLVYIGDASNLSNRMLYIKAIIEKEEGVEGEIHVEGDLNKENVFFREKE